MHTINETFSDEEFTIIDVIKKKTQLSWHDFILEGTEQIEKSKGWDMK